MGTSYLTCLYEIRPEYFVEEHFVLNIVTHHLG